MKIKKKAGWLWVAGGMASLAISMVLLFMTGSVFSTVFFYLSFALNIIGVYILLWGRNGGKENGSK